MSGSRVGDRPSVWIVGSGYLNLRLPLMRLLRQRGFQLAAVGQDDLRAEFAEQGFPYFQYPLTRSLDPLKDWSACRYLTRLFAAHRPDIVHAFNTKPTLLASRAAHRVPGTKVVKTITGLGAAFSSDSLRDAPLRWTYRQLQRRTSGHGETTVFQNPDDRDYFLRHGLVTPGRAEIVLGSGIDVAVFSPRATDRCKLDALRQQLGVTDRFVITMIARLVTSKGIAEFMQAAEQVRKIRPDAAFLLVGSPTTAGPQAFPVERVKANPHVLHLAPGQNITDLLAITDVFTLPSYFREGVPRVLLEAGAMQLPLITTDMPGCREVVQHNRGGLLIPPRDADALTQAVLHLMSDARLRHAMGLASREHVRKHFRIEKVAESYERIYRNLLPVPRQLQAAA